MSIPSRIRPFLNPRPLLWLTLMAMSAGACDGIITSEPGSVELQPLSTERLSGSRAIVMTRSGPVQGGINPLSRYYLGIPYAAPPTGALRWTPPAAPLSWTSVRPATTFGFVCPQSSQELPASEDCLTLNLWTPNPSPKRAPVMVFIHGGGFIQGSSASPTYNGQSIAERTGTVVVSLNYRLGALGFLFHPALGSDSGNYGLMDQQAALRWVQKNIAAFGGDPQNVTIFGESAGGCSVSMHLVLPDSAGLFQRAIMESGPAPWNLPSFEAAAQQGQLAAQQVGCGTGSASEIAACLRGVPAEQLVTALPMKVAMIYGEGYLWQPVVNGTTLPAQPLQLLEAGQFHQVPVLLGTNADEGAIFALAPLIPSGKSGALLLTDAEYQQIIRETFGDERLQAIYARYNPSKYAPELSMNSQVKALSALLGDWFFVCPTRRGARAISAHLALAGSTAQTFLYRFAWEASSGAMAMLGSVHGAELPFVFHQLTNSSLVSFTSADVQLADSIVGFWTSFAQDGQPNVDAQSQLSWPAYDLSTEAHLVLNHQLTQDSQLEQEQCNFWDGLQVYELGI
jgi:para-nitrobenzyl esterase